MAFAVSVGSGYSRCTVRFPTAAQALGEARNQVESDAKDVRITVAATAAEFTPDEFEAHMRGKPPSSVGRGSRYGP